MDIPPGPFYIRPATGLCYNFRRLTRFFGSFSECVVESASILGEITDEFTFFRFFVELGNSDHLRSLKKMVRIVKGTVKPERALVFVLRNVTANRVSE